MTLQIGLVTIDCANPQRLAEFWTRALGWRVLDDYGAYLLLGSEDRRLPGIGLQRVSEPKQGKARIHLDLRTDDIDAEVDRLVGLGATKLAEHTMPGFAWAVLTDPEDNEFCVGHYTG